MSSYTKQTFVDGQILRAEHMNHIEDGIASLTNDLTTSQQQQSDLTDAVSDVQNADQIVCDTTGAMITTYDAAAADVQGLVSSITAAQAGTGDPSPDNIRAISGWDAVILSRTQRNILGFEDFSLSSTGVYSDTYTDGAFRREVSIAVETTYAVSTDAMQYLKHPYIPAGTYTFSATYTSSTTYKGLYLEVTLADGTIAKLTDGVTTTIAMGGTITGVRMTSQALTVGSVIEFAMQLEAGAGTSYEPYSGATMTATLPETVYGGSLDWTTGVLTVTHLLQTLTGTESWTQTDDTVPNYLYTGTFYTIGMKTASSNAAAQHICSHYQPTSYANRNSLPATVCELNNSTLCIRDEAHATLAEFTAYLAEQAAAGTPATIVWECLPKYYTTQQIDPQQLTLLKGYNAVWSDAGDTSIAYIADTKLYIDNAIATLTAAIAGI